MLSIAVSATHMFFLLQDLNCVSCSVAEGQDSELHCTLPAPNRSPVYVVCLYTHLLRAPAVVEDLSTVSRGLASGSPCGGSPHRWAVGLGPFDFHLLEPAGV